MRRKIAIATVAAAALIGTGGAVAFAQNDDSRPSAQPSSVQQGDANGPEDSDDLDDSDDSEDTVRSAKRTAAEAADIAQKAAPGTVIGIELDDDKRGPVWEVDLAEGSTSHEVRLDAATGKVFFQEKEGLEDAVPSGLKVSAADAARKAASKGTVTSVDIDDDANDAWEVETAGDGGKAQEWRVDARSGEVTEDVSDDGRHDDGRYDDDRYDDRDDDGRHGDDRDDDGRHDDDRYDDRDDDRYDDSGHHGRHGGDDDGDDDGGRHGGHGGSGRH